MSYFLIPKKIFFEWFTLIGLLFMLVFSITLTCIVRNIKEKVVLARTSGASVLSILAVVIGFSALQVCGVGAPVCSASIGLGLFSFLFPAFFNNLLQDYSIHFIVLSIIVQVISLFFMNCFKEVKSVKNG